MRSSPRRLQPYVKAYKLRQQESDRSMWVQGLYFMRAVQVALDQSFSKNSTAEYFKEPLLADDEELKRPSSNPESDEQIAVYEFKQRIHQMEKDGYMLSPE